MKAPKSGGGWQAIKYTLGAARRVGWMRMLRAARSRNTCKTCAVGMGGQLGGMRNEAGHWPEVCKKSLQAMVADMQGAVQPEFFERFSIDELRAMSPRELEAAGRLVHPVVLEPGQTHYRVIGWDDALSRIAGKLKATNPREVFFYSSGRSSNEAGFLLQLLARQYGTNHVNNCSFYCHQASGVGLGDSLGTGTATVSLEDLDHADLFFLIGGNPASNHPRLMRTLMLLRRRGGRVIVINPAKETGLVNFRVPSDVRSLLFGSPIASLYLQPHIGGDIALLTGIAKAILEVDAADQSFIDGATEGWSEFRSLVESTSWEDVVASSGVERDQIIAAAKMYASSRATVFGWTMGITHHLNGVANVQTIVNLALMRGMVGRQGAGLLPIRGHSNVQGIGSVGVAPALKQVVLERMESHFGFKAPSWQGHDTMACVDAADRGELIFGLCVGGNLFGSNPDAAGTARALGKMDAVAYLSTSLNTGHAWGLGRETVILPVQARDEESQKTTQESMFNFVRLSDGGEARHPGPRSEVDIIASIASDSLGEGGPIDWQALREHQNIRQAIARIVPGLEKLAEIGETGREFHIGGRVLHAARFPTPDGKARFRSHPIPVASHGPGTLRLMTVRSEGQFNTVVFEEEDIYRGQDRRDVILLNPLDIKMLGLRQNQLVTVRSAVGEVVNIIVREFDVRAGNALMYYPEANVLVPKQVDPRSRTPAFKSVEVTLHHICGAVASDRVSLSVSAGRQAMKAC
jgi:molybdopterin-dependent oxidoreductase alpha subunit